MKLYYSPGACSLSPHIVLREGGFSFDLVRVDLRSARTEDGLDFRRVNPLGYVPVLALDDGECLTEGPAIVQFLADRVPDRQLAPPPGSMARYRLIEWLNFISTELHKGFGPLFMPKLADEAKAMFRERLAGRIGEAQRRLGELPYAMGEQFTVVDAYLFTVLNWTGYVGMDLGQWPALSAYRQRVASRPAVQEALRAEGLLRS